MTESFHDSIRIETSARGGGRGTEIIRAVIFEHHIIDAQMVAISVKDIIEVNLADTGLERGIAKLRGIVQKHYGRDLEVYDSSLDRRSFKPTGRLTAFTAALKYPFWARAVVEP